MSLSNDELESRRLRWVNEVISNGGDHTAAAIAVGFKRGRNAKQAGYRMSQHPQVKELLKDARERALREAMLTANESVASLARDIKFDPASVFHKDGRPKMVHEIDEPTRVALRGYKVRAITKGTGKKMKVIGYDVEVKFPEKTAAREQAMKHFGLYERDNKQKPFYTPPALYIEGVKGKGK